MLVVVTEEIKDKSNIDTQETKDESNTTNTTNKTLSE